MVPDVQAVSVNEWPAPTALTRRPSAAAVLTARTRSSSVVGRATVAGTHCWLPAQFRHRLRAARVRVAVWESLTEREPKPLPGCGLSRAGSAGRAPPPGLRRPDSAEPLRAQLRALSASMSRGTTLCTSPTTPRSAMEQMGASRSLLMATMFLDPFIPTMCWVAPEMPQAMYTVGLTVLPVWPTWWE